MVLNPLADVGIRMFVAIRVGCGQLVVDILGHGEWSQPQKNTDHPSRYSNAE
jgi:hypothetical protein